MISHEQMLEDVSSYALGALPEAESAGVIEHLRTCAVCCREYAELRDSVTAVAYSAQACATGEDGPRVSPLLKGRIMRAVRSGVRSRRRRLH